MGDLIKFPSSKRHDREIVRIKSVADELDSSILSWVESGIQPHEIAGIVAHRLGSLIKHVDDSSVLVEFCQDLIAKQAVKPSADDDAS